MRVLAIDTSSKICSVAIVTDKKELIIEEYSEDIKEHSIVLIPMIKKTLKNAGLKMSDIDLVAVGIGPGSFTGIRIGIATAKAIADARKIPIVGINSLEAIAYQVARSSTEDCKVASIISAKNDNVYFGMYRFVNGKFSVYKNAGTIKLGDVVDYLTFDEKLYLAGDILLDKIESTVNAKMETQKAECSINVKDYQSLYLNKFILASSIGMHAADKFKNGLYDTTKTLRPMYLRRSQAEREKDGEDSRRYFLEMGSSDLDEIIDNYEEFENSWTKETLIDDYKSFNNSKYIIVKRDSEIQGFIIFNEILSEIEIINLVTRKTVRNQGVASDLLSYVIRNNKATKYNLEVNVNNIQAIRLYKKFGFNEVGFRKNYYKGKEDAILMSL